MLTASTHPTAAYAELQTCLHARQQGTIKPPMPSGNHSSITDSRAFSVNRDFSIQDYISEEEKAFFREFIYQIDNG